MKAITVRLGDEVHRRVKVRAAAEGVAMEALGRAFFEGYAGGNGLSAGDPDGTDAPRREGSSGFESRSAVPASPAPAERPFQPDWKKGKK